MELKQANVYKFNIIKGLYPDKPGGLFVLLGPDNKKYLLEIQYYTHYGLKIGQEIMCKVDKINCTGQVFLEPENPVYKAGNKYNFTIHSITDTKDIYGNTIYQARVIDIHGKEWPVLVNKPINIEPGKSEIKCKVIRIKKAALELESEDYKYRDNSLKIGDYYQFMVRGDIILNGQETIEVEDIEGRIHYLERELYSHFGLKSGDNIQARVMDRKPDLSYKLEPLNPAYQLNNTYSFDVVKFEKIKNPIGETSGIIHIRDRLGQVSLVKAHDWQLNQEKPPQKIWGKVINFKRGKLQIQNLSQDERIKMKD